MTPGEGLRERRRYLNGSLQRSEARSDYDRTSKKSGGKGFLLVVCLCFCVVQVLVLVAYDLLRGRQCKKEASSNGFQRVTGDAPRNLDNEQQAGVAGNNESVFATDIMITIYSYDRPRSLLQLLKDIAREGRRANRKVMVHVVDDNSFGCTFPAGDENVFDEFEWRKQPKNSSSRVDPVDLVEVDRGRTELVCPGHSRFGQVRSFLKINGWRLFVAKHRHARRRYWHLIHLANSLLRNVRSKFYYYLPDDNRLSQDFFSKTIELWKSAKKDTNLMTMMLHHEETRTSVPVWTDLKPRRVSEDLHRIGWVESGNFMCTSDLLEFVRWSFPRVQPERWIDNPPISSGVGALLSQMLYDKNLTMYRTDKSFVAHMGVYESKMNAAFREKTSPSLLTRNFVDGDEAYQALLDNSSSVTASIASKWTRIAALQAAVDSLAPQVDHINVYLNDYESIPPFLHTPYISVLQSQNTKEGDIGDIGKFYWANDIISTYHLTADDDIIYPLDYVEKMISFAQSHEGPVAVGVHGIKLKPGIKQGYYGSREVFMGVEQVEDEVGVHILGTGTMLYRVSDVGAIDVKNVFKEPNMADVWFGIHAQTLKLPMVVIPHQEGWLREVPGTFEDSLYKKFTKRRLADRVQTRAVRLAAPWTVHEAVKK
eukprot:Plantae.Rhodophyta-Hildenbrandia_rubra.ctg2014.p1 GENE.Plantae.Rhodophyta-Hildenbrandia_rubra.ctg2014~~Plantae.Rhodophyta-Hildenbrandia_rubra.ctg2014.p1  ORF type:complete len:652 (-),score=86.62 Plantae.Rhodophyta-Hildenbrandia_rubra.ctg2014:621-2576(-)